MISKSTGWTTWTQTRKSAGLKKCMAIALAGLFCLLIAGQPHSNAAGLNSGQSELAQSSDPFNSNSCNFANDGLCDEPTNCDIGTDTADCRDALGRPIPNSCNFRNDNVCDEPRNCIVGTDTQDCYDPAGRPIPDSCNFARDGECDEPLNCIFGTDTSDCS